MNSPSLTAAYLESLATCELIKLAEKYSIDIQANLNRVCIIEELLDNSGKNTDSTGEDKGDKNDFDNSVALPGQYNISFIDVNVRDPLWVFAFWEIKHQDREMHEKSADFGGYCLNVIPLTDNRLPDSASSFTVAVGINDLSLYLGIPPGQNRRFRIELRAKHESGFEVLTVSRPFILPNLIIRGNGAFGHDSKIQAVFQNPLAQLSGVDSYSLTRSVDRMPRKVIR